MDCQLCDYKNKDLKKFSTHINSAHNLTSEQYTINVFHVGVRPACPICSSPTRYVSFSFKKYCKDHSTHAMKEGGKVGGKAPAWNKGATKETDQRLMVHSIKSRGENNAFYGRHHTQETLEKISRTKLLGTADLQERINLRSSEFTCLTPLDQYSSRQQQYLLFKCKVCGTEQPKTLQAYERGSRCYKCVPISKSNWELEVHNFVRQVCPDAISGDRNILSPKEIDVYVPSRKIGIECHGLYWHSEARPDAEIDPKKHVKKLELAAEKGIRLIQIFYDEWRDKRELIQDMITYRLGYQKERVKTWSTKVIELDEKERSTFFNSTHIAGSTPCKMAWGLRDRNGRIVAAISLRVPRHLKKYSGQIEVARFSTLPGCSVPGGLSKLLSVAKSWSQDNGYKHIMTYVDRRIGTGDGWMKAGFVHVGKTAPDYWYTDLTLRYDRFKFRAKDGKSEKQVAMDAGVSRIWGCGSLILALEI